MWTDITKDKVKQGEYLTLIQTVLPRYTQKNIDRCIRDKSGKYFMYETRNDKILLAIKKTITTGKYRILDLVHIGTMSKDEAFKLAWAKTREIADSLGQKDLYLLKEDGMQFFEESKTLAWEKASEDENKIEFYRDDAYKTEDEKWQQLAR